MASTVKTYYIDDDQSVAKVFEGGTGGMEDMTWMCSGVDRKVIAEIHGTSKGAVFMVYALKEAVDVEDYARSPFGISSFTNMNMVTYDQLPEILRMQILLGAI